MPEPDEIRRQCLWLHRVSRKDVKDTYVEVSLCAMEDMDLH